MVRAFIVDDEPPARARLRQLLTEAGDVVVVGEAGDAVEARAALPACRPDVIFLDIEMPQESGTSLAGSLPEPRPFVVFATAFDRYALEAFGVDATDYLVKPITRARLAGTLSRVRDRLARRSDLERDVRDASATQALLLPRTLPPVDGYDTAALTLPARSVGGDFFLGQAVTADRVVYALGDVSGKGLPAGLVASSLQARLEAVATHGAGSATDIVAGVNRVLCERSETSRFATLAYLLLDTTRHHLTIVNAGHPPVFVIGPGHDPLLVAATAPALGIMPDARVEAREVPLAPGELVLLYSDGVTEAFDADEVEFGEDRLARLVAAHIDRPAATICQAVVNEVRRHAVGGVATDDVTVLVIKRLDDRGVETAAS
jgi:sigma-B regulation protein RsbU (phosphoserine phosphatase)